MLTTLIEEGRHIYELAFKWRFIEPAGREEQLRPHVLFTWFGKTRGWIKSMFGSDSIEFAAWEEVRSKLLSRQLSHSLAITKESARAVLPVVSEALALLEEWSVYAATVSDADAESQSPLPRPNTVRKSENAVFLVHGHDLTNTLRLKELLTDRFGLTPVVLVDKPGSGRTIIQKFEEEARKCSFAFAILTPDDQVQTSSGEYTQARPNVLFELGWLYSYLGRERVVILTKEGTQVHSDLEGIERYVFATDIREQALKIEDELVRAGLISLRAGLARNSA